MQPGQARRSGNHSTSLNEVLGGLALLTPRSDPAQQLQLAIQGKAIREAGEYPVFAFSSNRETVVLVLNPEPETVHLDLSVTDRDGRKYVVGVPEKWLSEHASIRDLIKLALRVEMFDLRGGYFRFDPQSGFTPFGVTSLSQHTNAEAAESFLRAVLGEAADGAGEKQDRAALPSRNL